MTVRECHVVDRMDGTDYVTYAYTPDNLLATISNAEAFVTYTYANDRTETGYVLSFADGSTFTRTVTRDPHRPGLVTSVTNCCGSAVRGLAYTHDDLSRPISRNVDTFGYNERGEVVEAIIEGNTESHAYDLSGNSVFAAFNSFTNIYTANSLNQYSSISTLRASVSPCETTPTYDADGNLISVGPWTYTYDSASRLVSVSSNGVLLVTNAYDYRGRRVRKTTSATTHTFLYDDWNLIHETAVTVTGETDIFEYFWGRDLSGSLQGAGGVGGLLYVKLNGAVYIPFTDANGNITAYVDSIGAVVTEYVYDCFGRTISQSGPLADVFHHRFSSKYFDGETGLYYYGYRFYSPSLMRWLNRDPIGEDGGLDLYVFVLNEPVGSLDVLGNRRANLLGIVMDGLCEDAYRYAMGKMQTSEERRAWDRYTDHGWSGRDRDIELSPSEVKSVAESIKAVVSHVEHQRKACKGGVDFSVSISIGGATPPPWVKALGGVSVKVITRCSGGCYSYEYQINDLYDFDIKGIPGFTSRAPEGEVATIGVNLVQICLQCDWKTFYHKGVYSSK